MPDSTAISYTETPGTFISDDYTFKSGQTYFVRGPVTMTGKATIQGGAIIKFDEASTGAGLTLLNAEFATASADWAVFTSKNDDTVGEKISGSTGTPGYPDYGTALALNGGSARFIQVRYANQAIAYDGTAGNLSVRDAEFFGVGTPLAVSASTSPATVELANILIAFSRQGPVFDDRGQQAVTVAAHNLSFYLVTGAAFDAHLTAGGSSFLVADSLFDYVLSSVFAGTPPGVEHHNAFYRSPVGSGPNDLALASDPMLADWFLDQASPLIDGGSRPATAAGLYSYTTNKNLAIEATTTVDIGYHLPRTVRGFSILAMDEVRLQEKASVVAGDVGVINAPSPLCKGGRHCRDRDHGDDDQDWALTLGEKAVTPGGYGLFADSLRIAKKAVAGGNVYYNALNNKGSIAGSRSSPLPLPLFDVLPAFKSASFGALAVDVKVKEKNESVLTPGDYRDIVVGEKGSLVFQGGVYNIRSLRAKEGASISFRGLAELRIQRDFRTGRQATVKPADGASLGASDIMFYVAGGEPGAGSRNDKDDDSSATISFGEGSMVVGHFYAPYGSIRLKERADLYGILLGKQVVVGQEARVTLDTRANQQGVVSSPDILPHGGSFWDSVQVEMLTITSGAAIYYTLDGSTPSRSSTLYTGAFILPPSGAGGTTVNAIAVRDGYIDSAVASAVFMIQPRPTTEAVTMAPVSGSYWDSVVVSLASATPGATIHYTLDGSTPTRSSTLYSAPVTLTVNTIITAFAVYPEYHDSRVSAAMYAVKPRPATEVVTMTPAAGTYPQPVSVSLTSATPGASIYYTLDGAAPTRSSALYSAPILLAKSAVVTAFAVYPEYHDSPVTSASYTIQSGPPDPATVAPPLTATLVANVASNTSFLYSGDNPIQKGVAPGTIEAKRGAVVRGRVLDINGNPLPGVNIAILNHPEFGSTESRQDGYFDMAVNGGYPLVVTYGKSGYLRAQRRVDVPWQDFAIADEVAMVALDANATSIDLTQSASLHVARGSVMSDADGTRQAVLMFNPGTSAQMVLPDGTTQALTTLAVRATEFTVGPNGPKAMPAQLPPATAYTYAVEFSVDEAMNAGASSVVFNQPVPGYVDNFLGFPAGADVPSGYYDRALGKWVASDNGRVVKVLGVTNGLADLDIDGSGQPATASALTALGVTAAERQSLAALYAPGKSLWRVPMSHFTVYDWNWTFGFPLDAIYPSNPPPKEDTPPDNCNKCTGSAIQAQAQVMTESVPVAGTPFKLTHTSDRVRGYGVRRSIDIPLIGTTVPASLLGIELTVSVAGRVFTPDWFGGTPNLSYGFTWDGRDAYNRPVNGAAKASITIAYHYPAVFSGGKWFGAPRTDAVFGTTRLYVSTYQHYDVLLNTVDTQGTGLAGWTLDNFHFYDPFGKTVHKGDGKRQTSQSLPKVIDTVVGKVKPLPAGYVPPAGTLGSALSINFNYQGLTGLKADGQGNIYVIHDACNISKVAPDGMVYPVLGGGCSNTGSLTPDGAAALTARGQQVTAIALNNEGEIYFGEGAYAVKKIDSQGVIRDVVRNWTGTCGDEGLAINACLDNPNSLAFDSVGNLYIAVKKRVRMVDTRGIIHTVAGGGTAAPSGGGAAVNANLDSWPLNLAVDSKDNLYIRTMNYIFRVTPNGIIKIYAGDGSSPPLVQGAVATQTNLGSFDSNGQIAIDRKDNLYYFTDFSLNIITAEQRVYTLAGRRSFVDYPPPVNLPALNAFMTNGAVAIGPDQNVYMADTRFGWVTKLAQPLPGFTVQDTVISSGNGAELYVFGLDGRHKSTVNADTGATIYAFAYDAQGKLVSLTDVSGRVTQVQYDASGNMAGIVSSDGQVTSFAHDANGNIIRVTNGNGESTQFTYSADGLITSKTDPRGNATEFTYDALGRLTRDTDAAGGSQTFARSVNSASKYTVTDTTGMNRVYSFSVESLGVAGGTRKTSVDPAGFVTTILEAGNYDTTTTTPDGMIAVDWKQPDPRWGMQSPVHSGFLKAPSGLTMNFSSTRAVTLADPANLFSLSSQTDTSTVNGRVFTSVFNRAQLKTVNTSAENRQTAVFTDVQGRIVKSQITNLSDSDFTYDSQGRLTGLATGTGTDRRTTTIAYNPQGFVDTIADPLLRTTRFQYDGAGRVTQSTLPDGRIVAYTYDASGNLTSVTPPSRPAHLFAYNAVDMETGYTPPALTGVPTTATQYAYNLDKQVTAVTRPDGQTINFNYDTGGRLSSLALPGGASIGYQYSATSGKLTTITSGQAPALPPSGSSVTLAFSYDGSLPLSSIWTGAVTGSVSRTYDNNFRVSTMSVNGANTVALAYDKDSLLTGAGSETLTRDPANGFLTGTALNSVTDSYAYNGFGETTGYTAKTGTLPVYSTQFTRDALGRITQKSETVGTTTINYAYTYDPGGRLIAVSRGGVPYSSYQYYANGNRLAKTMLLNTVNGAYDAQDRLTGWNGMTYAYTANGELLSKTSTAGTTAYTYDVLGSLLKAVLPNGTTVDYLIDGMNRRIGKKVNGVLVKGWLYDGIRPVAELDGTGAVISTFVYASKGNSPDYMVKGGSTYRIISDHLGSPRLVIDSASGAVMQQIDYDEFGMIVSDTNPGFQPFGFAGGLYDPDTKLTRFGARDYDAETGRWTAKDPIRFSGGDTNLYGYVLNDPVNFVDMLGFWRFATEYGTKGTGLTSNMTRIEHVVDKVFNDIAKRDAVVTYTTNGAHIRNSRHYSGNAIDLRTRDMSSSQKQQAVTRLRNNLNSDYDIINEGNHIHIEYDPKNKRNELFPKTAGCNEALK